MHNFFITTGVILLLLIMAVLYRAASGPSVIDRIVAVNIIGTKTTVLLIVIGVIFGRVDMFVDFALTYALLNFIASLAAAKFFLRHKTVDPTNLRMKTGKSDG